MALIATKREGLAVRNSLACHVEVKLRHIAGETARFMEAIVVFNGGYRTGGSRIRTDVPLVFDEATPEGDGAVPGTATTKPEAGVCTDLPYAVETKDGTRALPLNDSVAIVLGVGFPTWLSTV